MMKRLLIMFVGLVLLWQLFVWLTHTPTYIVPRPWQVLQSLWENWQLIWHQAIYTIIEAVTGFILATLLGCLAALSIVYSRVLRLWFLPVLLISQALPTFAIAPLFVLWLGYDMSSKIATTVLMLFFPIASAFYDGLRNTNSQWLAMATTMRAKPMRVLWHVRIPAALPSLGSGLRMAAAYAPMGAVIGEWVGSSRGLGFLILTANAQVEIPLMFAALFILVVFTLLFYAIVDRTVQWTIRW